MGSSPDIGTLESDYVACGFDALPDWAEDDHLAAFRAFLSSCPPHAVRIARTIHGPLPFQEALALGADIRPDEARKFFETHFEPFCRQAPRVQGFVTGYYEPILLGALERSDRFNVPVYGLPTDLVPLESEVFRAANNDKVTARRRRGSEMVDYFTRAEIENGALEGRGLELLYVGDWVELFFMHVQGSGRVQLDDGSWVRLSFAGKNGHPYTSIAKVLVEKNELSANEIDMARLKAWLRAAPERGRRLLQENKSYIFFRILTGVEGSGGPLGAEGVTLTPGRSLAIDPVCTPLGCPVYVAADRLLAECGRPFARLMIGQDVGSAIRGPERGDIFWGTGDAAGEFAGSTRHQATFFLLLPKR